jgi:fatty-acyl-CoA synthase
VLLAPEVFLARPALWLRALSRHRGTVSPAPNFAYGLCLKRVRDDDLAGVDLSSWRCALNGAEPVSAEVMRALRRALRPYGFRREALMPVYGLSEASLAVTFTRPSARKRVLASTPTSSRRRPAAWCRASELVPSVGTPVPGAEVEVRDGARAALRSAPWAASGRAPLRHDGLLRPPEATARVLRDGWLDTGDLGFVDGGELFLCGRAKDVVIIRGANHAPQEFEECLDGVDGVRTGCAVALGYAPAGADGERSSCWSRPPPPSGRPRGARGADAVVERTGVRAHTVVELLAPGTLPRTSSGKLRRAEALRSLPRRAR